MERKRGLREHQILPSMSRPANPYDNATCESFIKILKREIIYASEYRDFEDLLQSIEEFVDRLSGHPKPANEGHLKTGQRESPGH